MVRALARLAGVNGFAGNPNVDYLCQEIGFADHYVFVLIDALGMRQVRRLPENSFLRQNLSCELQAVFLSSTATALTSLATGQWPCTHGVPGWFVYLVRHDTNTIPLQFCERNSMQPLSEFGISAEEIYPLPSFWPTAQYTLRCILPKAFTKSPFQKYASGSAECIGYSDTSEAIKITTEKIRNASRPHFTYLYLDELDALLHKNGTGSKAVAEFLRDLDAQLSRLSDASKCHARLVVTSDHGQVDVPEGLRFFLPENDPLLSYLVTRPTGTKRTVFFHVRQGNESTFAEKFRRRFGEHFALLTPDEVEELGLLGPEKLSPTARQRLGTYVGISFHPATFFILPGGKPENIGAHGGLCPEEMSVPLVIC